MDYAQHHALEIAALFQGDLKIVALLHDHVEDGISTLEQIAAQHPAHIVAAVDAITRRRGEIYADYIRRVALDPLARQVKIADIEHHLATGGIPASLVRRYDRALAYLTAAP